MSNTSPILTLLTNNHPTLLNILDHIIAHPHQTIQIDTPIISLKKLTKPDTKKFLALISNTNQLTPTKNRPTHFNQNDHNYFFTHIINQKQHITQDTPPNRFVQQILKQFRDTLTTIDDTNKTITITKHQIQTLLNHTFLTQIPRNTHTNNEHIILHKNPHYHQIMKTNITLAHLQTKGSTPQKAHT